MAQVATELLTEFGMPISAIRTTRVIDPVSGVTSTDSKSISMVGLVKPYEDKLINETSILSADRLMITDYKVEPQINDVVIIYGRSYTLINVTASNPAGVPIVYFSQLRL